MNTARSDAILARMMSMHPKVIDLTLGRMLQLLPALGNPQDQMPPIIHIAGTNGKGSTQAMIRAGLEAAGKSVHAYTSPHLAYFHERIRVAGEIISEDALTAILDECERACQGRSITFFEVTTAAAMLAFARTRADFTLMEVGLGGQFDATNVFDQPRLTIITPISIDHQQYLGETLPEIAAAKAGILKRRVPCIVGPQPDEVMVVIERQATRNHAPLLVYGQHWHVSAEHGRMVFQDENGLLDLPLPNLLGPHQIHNAGAALAALRFLGLPNDACEAAVTLAFWPARMQRLQRGPLVDAAGKSELWLDGGHNPAGGQAIAATLAVMPKRPTHLITGMLNTKDIAGYLRPLAAQAVSLHAVSIPGEKNTLPAETTRDVALSVGLVATTAATTLAAIRDITATDANCRILICGSLYLAGSVLREND
jgi:dihydrofolate synthase / folylpolyglutamate synthase